MHPMSEEASEMPAADAATEAMEPLPHEITELELEMEEAAESTSVGRRSCTWLRRR